MIRDGEHFHDIGADYFLKMNAKRILNSSIKRIESLGFDVKVEARKTA
jgi:hypothetical protein